MASRYWVGGTAAWDGTAGSKWSLTSGGAGGQAVPTSADDVFFTASSSGTCTTATGAVCKSLDFTGFTGSFVMGDQLDIYGSLTCSSGMTSDFNTIINFKNASGTATVTLAGKATTQLYLHNSGATLSPGDSWSGSVPTVTLLAGTFNSAGFNLTVNQFNLTGTSTATLGTTTLTCSQWYADSGATITSSGYTIKHTGATFTGGGKTYNNVWFSGSTATTTISGSNTFADLKCDKTITNTLKFTAGTTTTVTTFTVNGTAGHLCSLDSTTTGTYNLVGTGTINCSYLDIQHCVASGATWTASNSTDDQAVATAGSGWNFASSGSNNLFFGSMF